MFLLVVTHQPVDDAVVEILSAEMGVAGCGEDFEDFVFDGEDGYVEGASAEIVYEDFGLLVFRSFLVESIGDGGRGRLVEDTYDLEAGDGACVFCRLSLRVIEVCMGASSRSTMQRLECGTYMRGR